MSTTNTQSLEAVSSIDDLLDSTLDDLADMPEFKPYPAGAHRCNIKFEIKKINETDAVSMAIEGLETLELSDTSGETKAIEKGHKTNVLYMLKKKDGTANEIAQGQLKAVLSPLVAHFGASSNREAMVKASEGQGCEVVLITKLRADKRDPSDVKYYTDVVGLSVV